MSALLHLAARSLAARKGPALLTLIAIALSVALFVCVEQVRRGARSGFEATISGTHLIVGAPTGKINLLLYSVFRIGDATAEISWGAYQRLEARSDVDWAVPISLGDGYRGFRVMGTTPAYFERYKYAGGAALAFSEGAQFDDLFDAVIGAEVARGADLAIGDPVALSHGLGAAGIGAGHDNRPFKIVGILKPTGTPVDKTVHVSLEAITALHVGWESGTKNPLADTLSTQTIRNFDLTPKTVTAVYVGLKQRGTVLQTRYQINTDKDEPLMAIIPSEALKDLWQTTALAERALGAISAMVIAVGLVSILTSLLTSLNERRREMAILRATGARPGHIFSLLVLEAGLIGSVGAGLGILIAHVGLSLLAPLVTARTGVMLANTGPGLTDLAVWGAVTLAALLLGCVPAYTALKRSLADGLTLRV